MTIYTKLNIIGWTLLGSGWAFQFSLEQPQAFYFSFPLFLVAMAIFGTNLWLMRKK